MVGCFHCLITQSGNSSAEQLVENEVANAPKTFEEFLRF